MYKIYADDVLIYDDTIIDPYVKVSSPQLTLEYNAAGSLKMKIPPGTVGYDVIQALSTTVTVYKDDKEYWSGRVLQEDKDFWNNRSVLCEGVFAYFNDTTQPPATYDFTGEYVMQRFLEDILTIHNANVSDDRKIYVDEYSIITVDDPPEGIHVKTSYDKTIEVLNKLVSDYGGYMQVVKRNGTWHLDYLKDGIVVNPQTIEFGKNLIDFTSSFDASEYATVIVPLGVKLEKDPDSEGPDEYLTVEKASQGDGTIYVKANPDVIGTYGWIEKTVHWDEESDASELYKRGLKYLEEIQFGDLVIELSALDLHYLNPDITDVKLGDYLHVISKPHGLDRPFTVKRLEIPLDKPQDTIFKIGGNVKTSFTAVNNKTNSEIMAKVENAIDEDRILKAAQDHVTSLMNTRLNGYIVIEMDETNTYASELYISGSVPLRDGDGNYVAQRFWKWGLEGLGYTDDGGQTWKAAMTMDGTILGERIAAGSIHGSKISAGTLSLTTSSGTDAMTISVETDGEQVYDFERGDLYVDTGREDDTDDKKEVMSRLAYKLYLKEGATVRMLVNTYRFEVFKYSNGEDSSYISPPTGFLSEYTIPASRHYRFVVGRQDGQELTQNDLQAIGRSFVISNNDRAVIRAKDLQVIGMVTFSALGAGEGDEGYDSRTVINGGYLDTGTVKADSIDLYSGFTVYRNKVEREENKTFEIGTNGTIYINGEVHLSSDSTISFDSDPDRADMTLGDLADEPVAKQIANGTYNGNTFIGGRTIYSPDAIVSNALIAQGLGELKDEDGHIIRQASKSGSFILKDGENHERLGIVYNSDVDNAPQIQFLTNLDSSGDPSSVFYFNSSIEAVNGFRDYSQAESLIYGTVEVRGTISMENGGLIALHRGSTYFDNYNHLINTFSTPRYVGQIAFVLN